MVKVKAKLNFHSHYWNRNKYKFSSAHLWPEKNTHPVLIKPVFLRQMKNIPTSIKAKGREHLNQDLMGGSDSKGAVKAEHTRRSRHSGVGVNSRTEKGQKRTVKECKWLKKTTGSWRKETKRIEGLRRDEREQSNWSCTGRPGSRGGETSYQWNRWYTILKQQFWEKKLIQPIQKTSDGSSIHTINGFPPFCFL